MHIKTNEKEFRIGVVSDTHLGSYYEDLKSLEEMYTIFKKEGIKYVFNCGDLTDGIGVYRGQENFLKHSTTTEQARYFNKNYPKIEGIENIVITGNHDLKQFERGGMDVGELIIKGGRCGDDVSFDGREDIKYLGRYAGRVVFNNVKIDLVHPDYGFTYAISYSPQKYINELEGGSKPDILLFGHLHRLMYMNYRNIHLFMAGAFQKQSDYLKRKGIQPAIGGWIINIMIDRKKRLHRIKPEIYRFF